jgi:hypothetical protein
VFRKDGQSDQYRAFATMWRVPDNLLHVFLTLMHPLEVITSLWYPNIIWGENYYIAISPYLPRGERWLYSHFSWRKIYYIAIFSPIQVRGKYGYIAIFPGGGMAMGEKWLYNTGNKLTALIKSMVMHTLTNVTWNE